MQVESEARGANSLSTGEVMSSLLDLGAISDIFRSRKVRETRRQLAS